MSDLSFNKKWKLGLLLLSVTSIITLFFFKAYQSFDEPFFIKNSELFSKYGLSKDFLLNMRLQAPGPTYQVFHFFTSSFTGYNVVWMRLITMASLFGCIYLLGKIIASQNQSQPANFINLALLFFVVPTTWVYGTMAITQIPAMLCALGFVLLFNKKTTLTNSFVLGILLSLSILGRAHYGAFLLFCLFDVLKNFNKEIIIKNLIVFTTTVAICLPIFLVWQGYVPPDQQAAFSNSSHLHFSSVFTGSIFLFLFTSILSPIWLNRPVIRYFVIFFIITVSLNFLFDFSPYHSKVISSIFKFLPEKLISALPTPMYLTITLFTFYHYVDLESVLKLKMQGMIGLIIVATILSGLRSTQFSDGYVFQVLPLIIMFNYEKISSKWFVPKYLLMASLGFIYLLHRMMII